MKSILFNIVTVTKILAAASGISTGRSLNNWRRAVRSATPGQQQHDLAVYELSPGGNQHMAFEVPIVERVGSRTADYEAELVTGRRCMHLLWTSARRVITWTTRVTRERGCESDDDVEVEDYEDMVEKELKRRQEKGRQEKGRQEKGRQ